MCIDHLSKLGCLFKPCTCAAPERIIRSAIHLIVARLHRSIINAHSLIRIIVGENMIKQYILIIIYFFNLTIITEQPFRQTQHIHRITGFRSTVMFNSPFKFFGSKEMFTCTISSHYPSVFIYYGFPKEAGRLGKLLISIITINRLKTSKLRNLSICMPTLQNIPSFRHRYPHIFIIQHLRPFQISLFSCYLIHIHKRLIDRAMLTNQQFLNIFMRQLIQNGITKPISHLHQNILSLW